MYILMLWQKHIGSGLIRLLIDSFLAISGGFAENLKPKNKKKNIEHISFWCNYQPNAIWSRILILIVGVHIYFIYEEIF